MFFIPTLLVVACGGGGFDLLDWATLGGQVLTQDGSPLEGIEVIFSFPDSFPEADPMIEVTDQDGWYIHGRGYFDGDDDTIITPSHPAYIFSPVNYIIYGNSGDNLDLDFTAILIE
jgi:hypothetical protein